MNKKGALFHWMIFGILVAIGLFLVIGQKSVSVGYEVKGTWQLDFLDNYFFEAEKDLLNIDMTAKEIVWESVLSLGKAGGFHKNLPCGQVKLLSVDYAIWNKGKVWVDCIPKPEESLASRIEEKLKLKLPKQKYSEVKLDKKIVTGKGEPKSISSTSGKFVNYTYDTSFRINVGFDVEKDYDELHMDATDLVGNCRGNLKLQKCIKENKKKTWKFKDCDAEAYTESDNKVVFCAESPQKAKVYKEGKLVPVRYLLALDFSAVK
ncbi:hypothetical protein ACFL0E_00620 [Nanoarchaeota archaeon]